MFTLDFLNQVANGLEKDSMYVSCFSTLIVIRLPSVKKLIYCWICNLVVIMSYNQIQTKKHCDIAVVKKIQRHL